MAEPQPVVAYTGKHVPPESADHAGPTTAELVSRLGEQVTRLVRDEMRLAQKELTRQGKRAGVGGGALGFAGLVAAFGLGALAAAGGLALTRLVPNWAAALVTGGGLLLIAGFSALVGALVLRRVRPVPEETLENLRTDVRTIREGMVHR